MDANRIDKLSELVALRARRKLRGISHLRVVTPNNLRTEIPSAPARDELDAQTRDIMYSRIRDLAGMYNLWAIVRQETAATGGKIECLEDADLKKLRENLEQARECIIDDVPFDYAGLIKRSDS